jgi:peptidoglycan/LPS O-acetylase OafA/YrhL
VLSGYLSLSSALKKENFSIKEYYVSRFKKIYFPLLVVTSITIIVFNYTSSDLWLTLKAEVQSVFLNYNNFWQLGAQLDYFTKHLSSPLIHLWYISILIQFELVFPIAFVLLKKLDEKINKHISVALVGISTIALTAVFYFMSITQDLMSVYYNTFARAFSILVGVFLALAGSKYGLKTEKKHAIINTLVFLFYLAFLIVLCVFANVSESYYSIYMIVASFISARLIAYAVTNGEEKKNEKLNYFSRLTYVFYLVQYPVMFFMQDKGIGTPIKIALIIAVSFLITMLIDMLFNVPKKHKKIRFLCGLICASIIVFGVYTVVMYDDHAEEIKELQEKLDDTLKLVEERKNAYLEKANKEQEEWNLVLESMESGEKAISEYVHNLPVVGVGDSVLLAASKGLYDEFPNGYFDGKVSRTILGGQEVLMDLQNKGKLGEVIILALANNGDYITKRNQNLMTKLEGKQVYWINAVKADVPEFNEYFKEFAKDYPNLHIIDWEGYSKEHPEFFYADGIHVKGDGIGAYGKLVYDSIYNDYLNEYRAQKEEMIKKHEEEVNEEYRLLEEENQKMLDTIYDELEKSTHLN